LCAFVVGLALSGCCAEKLLLLTLGGHVGNDDLVWLAGLNIPHPVVPKEFYLAGIVCSVGADDSTKEVFFQERTCADVDNNWFILGLCKTEVYIWNSGHVLMLIRRDPGKNVYLALEAFPVLN
jgi:hypothetical protein